MAIYFLIEEILHFPCIEDILTGVYRLLIHKTDTNTIDINVPIAC